MTLRVQVDAMTVGDLPALVRRCAEGGIERLVVDDPTLSVVSHPVGSQILGLALEEAERRGLPIELPHLP